MLSVKRALASAVNVAVSYLISLPLTLLMDWRAALLISFLGYNLACEAFVGKCLGSMAVGLRWAGEPSLSRRLAFSVVYTIAFVPFVVAPLWLVVPVVFAVQLVWEKTVGGTVQSWAVGMRSEIEPCLEQ